MYNSVSLTQLLFEISSNSTLYHRSMKKMSVGDTIVVPKNKEGKHWLQSSAFEQAMEFMRQESYSDRPSRFNCVYSSLIPRSRFVDKGYLYVINPIGNIFMTNSSYIDDAVELFDRKFYSLSDDSRDYYKDNPHMLVNLLDFRANNYWEGITSYKNSLKNIEVLSDGAIITQVIKDKKNRLLDGSDVIITESDKLIANIQFYFKESTTKHDAKLYVDKCLTLFSDVHINGEQYGSWVLSGFLKKNTKLKLTYVHSSLSDTHDIAYEENKYRYVSVMFDFYINDILYKRSDHDPTFRAIIAYYHNPGVHDISRFMKIISR
jgi:hypothetical protein